MTYIEKNKLRLLEVGEEYFYYIFKQLNKNTVKMQTTQFYVDSNNLLHINSNPFYFHGIRCNSKEEWGLMEHREEMLGEI